MSRLRGILECFFDGHSWDVGLWGKRCCRCGAFRPGKVRP